MHLRILTLHSFIQSQRNTEVYNMPGTVGCGDISFTELLHSNQEKKQINVSIMSESKCYREKQSEAMALR